MKFEKQLIIVTYVTGCSWVHNQLFSWLETPTDITWHTKSLTDSLSELLLCYSHLHFICLLFDALLFLAWVKLLFSTSMFNTVLFDMAKHLAVMTSWTLLPCSFVIIASSLLTPVPAQSFNFSSSCSNFSVTSAFASRTITSMLYKYHYLQKSHLFYFVLPFLLWWWHWHYHFNSYYIAI